MKKINVYSTNVTAFRFGEDTDLIIKKCGYVEIENSDKDNFQKAEDVWELLNWSEYQKDKPENVHSDICACGSGVIIEIDNKFYLSLSFGFKEGNSIKELKQNLIDNPNLIFGLNN